MRMVFALVMACSMSGCLVDMLMTTAITADMAATEAATATSTMNRAEMDTAQIKLQEAVDLYAAENDSNPRSLRVLVPSHIDAIPTRPDGDAFGYNPIAGKIYPTDKGPSSEDYFTIEAVKEAINTFGQSTGYYPPQLDDLYPNYMAALPRTTAGEVFGYDNQNGRLTHPREGLQFEEESTVASTGAGGPVKPVSAIGSLQEGDLKDSNNLNKALDRMGY